MEAQKVDLFMIMNAKYFDSYQLTAIRDKLIQMDESRWACN